MNTSMRSGVLLIVIVCLTLVQSVQYVDGSLSDQYVNRYQGLDYVIPENTFVNYDNSSILISLSESRWITSELSDAEIQTRYDFFFALEVHQSGSYLVVVDYYAVVWILNMEDPSEPYVISRLDLGYVYTIASFLEGDYLYIIVPVHFCIVDITNKKVPFVASCLNIPDSMDDIYVKDDIAYITEDGTWIFDVTDKTNPVEIVFTTDISGVRDSVQIDEFLFIARSSGLHPAGIAIFNVTDLMNPYELTSDSYALAVSISVKKEGSDYYIFVCYDTNRFKTFFFNVTHLIEIYDDSIFSYDVTYRDDVIYVASNYDGMNLYDLTIIKSGEGDALISTIVADRVLKVASGDYDYVVLAQNQFGFSVVDVSSPGSPSFLYQLGGNACDVVNKGCGLGENAQGISVSETEDIIYVCSYGYGLMIFDVSSSVYPYMISTFITDELDLCYDVQVTDEIAYVATLDGHLVIVDVSDPGSPFELGSIYLDVGSMYSLHCIDTHCYTISFLDGMTIVDVSNTSDPLVVSNLDANIQSYDIYVKDEYAYIAAGLNGIVIMDGGVCWNEYEGINCESWSCSGIDFKEVDSACNGKGNCISPDVCDCYGGYVGDTCDTNMLYYTVMTPILSVSGIVGLVLLGIFTLVVCCCCFAIFILLVGCVLVSCVVVVRQFFGIQKFKKLKNFDMLLQEQKMEEDTSIAHLKFNKKLFELDFDSIKTMNILGEGGSSSVVLLAMWRGRKCAFKCFKTRLITSDQDKFDEFEREVEVLSSVSHPNIIRFFGACLKPPRVGILMEYCPKGEILEFVVKFRKDYSMEYPILQKIRFFVEILSALEYLHVRKIIHRDLKCENVLIDQYDTSKLMDFGLSRAVENMEQLKTKRIGTSIYMAPEIVLSDQYDEKVDCFSHAILMYVVLTEKENPYDANLLNIELKAAQDPDFRPVET